MPAHILYVDHTAALGGGEIALLNLLRYLDRNRFAATVVLFSDGPLVSRLRHAGIAVQVLPLAADVVNARKDDLGGPSLLRLGCACRALGHVWTLAALIRDQQVDLVHANSLKSDIIGGLAARLAGVPVIWHVRDRIDADYLPRCVAGVFRGLAQIIPDAVIANSSATRRTMGRSEHGQFVSVVHDGTDCNLYQAAPSRHRGSPLRIGLVGRISHWKGQHVFLRAAAKVRSAVPEARFLIIGAPLFSEQAYEQELRALADGLGISDVVTFTGFCDRIPEALAELDILVHASITGEPFGQVIIEAMAAGKPVIATDGGAVPEIVIDQFTGLVVPMNDPDAMAQAILRLAANAQAARAMGLRGRERVERCFTIQSTATKVQDIYARMLAHRTRRRAPAILIPAELAS